MTTGATTLDRSQEVLLGVFGRPRLTLVRGEGCYVYDADGGRHLDLLGGIAVSSLGHGHPALVEAVSRAARELVHVSNFFVTPDQVRLGERLLQLSDAPSGSRVFLCNSGTEAIEAVVKLSRRTGRTRIVAAEGAFHGRTTGALALTHKEAYRAPFEPLVGDVTFVPYDDVDALRAAVDDTVAAVVLEPIQGEAGVIPASTDYLRAAREATTAAGALLVLDEIQTGVGRTGTWFAHQAHGVRPDVMTLAKGLAGGVPIGAVVTFGERVSGLLGPGQHGTTFGGNPLACAAALAVLGTIEEDDLLEQVKTTGEHLVAAVEGLQHPLVRDVRGAGLLRAIALTRDVSAQVTAALEARGPIVNPVRPDAVRLAPPLVLTTDEVDEFVADLSVVLDGIVASEGGNP
ncbi:acetylornithine transaminase [Arsenicicoccus sp. MKL-02]|uniref:Acetylornithine aminotransferase n=1 Tax=Arsenicicoccus cauae TaxID=2663847 RepID=A0A6I3IDG7_9MICO|nr:acetylornithine transaminase [Arsenicicoccus cauae]MTB71767.1 acetylornithine transaminase [Arsenicicoccus cauae]